MSTSEAWFEATDLVITLGATRLSAPHLGVTTTHAALIDRAAELLPLLLQPGRWTSGRVTLGGRPLAELLASGEAGYAPLHLPGDQRLFEVLETSAKLCGAQRRDVQRAAARVGLGDALGQRLSRLSRVELRLGCLAHALTTEPRFLLLEDLLVDLQPHEADRLELALDRALDHTERGAQLLLFACHSRSKRSLERLRSLRVRKQAVTVVTAKQPPPGAQRATSVGGTPAAGDAFNDYVLSTSPFGSLSPKSVYLTLGAGEAFAFAQQARERGLPTAPLPGGHMVLVARADQERAVELAEALGARVVAVEEAHFGA